MSSHSKLLVIGLILQVAVGLAAAQGAAAGGRGGATKAYKMPFIAEVVGTDVNVRSGAGTSYYYTGKVSGPGRVTVVGEQTGGWFEIIPPGGSFSWIAKDKVDVDPANPGIGMVNDAGVRIWAGSDYRDPMRSSSLQVKLNNGDIVKLIGANSQKGDYYKIVPPPGAHLWISGNFLKYVKPITRPSRPGFTIEPKPKPEPKPGLEVSEKPPVPPVVKPPIKINENVGSSITKPPVGIVSVAKDGTVEKQRIDECYALAKQIVEELKKPLEAQGYDEYKRALTVVLNDPQAGRAVRYAKYQLGQITRFELAQQADRDVKKQDSALDRRIQEIKEKYAVRLAQIPDPGKYVMKGKIQPSLVYTGELGQKRYKVLNKAGKIICYAVPAESAIATNMDDFIGRPVGLKGTIVTDKSNPVGLVTFTAIEQLAAVSP